MPFVAKQPAYNVLYELIVRTINAVKELDSLQAERFQRKIRFALKEPNGEAGDSAIASAPPEEISTGDESAVCPESDVVALSNELLLFIRSTLNVFELKRNLWCISCMKSTLL